MKKPPRPRTTRTTSIWPAALLGVVVLAVIVFCSRAWSTRYAFLPVTSPQEGTNSSPSPLPATGTVYRDQYLSFAYPSTWQRDHAGIYEHRSECDRTGRCANEKNTLDVRVNLTQLYQGHTNPEWFKKMGSLTMPWESGRDVFTKLASGQTSQGKNYVIVKKSPTDDFQGEPLTVLIGYVVDDTTLYELRLAHYGSDQQGVQVLKSMVETLKVE